MEYRREEGGNEGQGGGVGKKGEGRGRRERDTTGRPSPKTLDIGHLNS